jgi:hypothetical protein
VTDWMAGGLLPGDGTGRAAALTHALTVTRARQGVPGRAGVQARTRG